MANANYSRTSPYSSTPQTNGYLDFLTFRDIPALTTDVQFTVTSQYKHRPDLLAYDLYQDVNLWWVFAVRNKNIIRDPVYDLIPGVKIYIPTKSSVLQALGS
jgi:hypothetical protein